jgi:hypothetical protein
MHKNVYKLIFSTDLNDIADNYPAENENGTKKSFDPNLMKLYAFYFEDQNSERLEKVKVFIGISTLVKIIEQKFVGAKMLKEKGNFGKIEEKRIEKYEEEWHAFKLQNFAHPSVDIEDDLNGMRELLDKLYLQYRQFHMLPSETIALNDR